MDNYYYFFRPTYQLWPYSRFSQTANEEGNVLGVVGGGSIL